MGFLLLLLLLFLFDLKKIKNRTNRGSPRVVEPAKQYKIYPTNVSYSATIVHGFFNNRGPSPHKKRSAYCDADALR